VRDFVRVTRRRRPGPTPRSIERGPRRTGDVAASRQHRRWWRQTTGRREADYSRPTCGREGGDAAAINRRGRARVLLSKFYLPSQQVIHIISSMESKTSSPESSGSDPMDDLAILDRARWSVEASPFFDFGPWWYAPALATTLGSLALYGHSSEVDGPGFWLYLFGAGLAIACAIHDFYRRKLRPKVSMRSIAWNAATFFVVVPVYAIWAYTAKAKGSAGLPAWAILYWIATTAFFLAVRSLLSTYRKRTQSVL